jgi:hypothetical protein
VGIEAGDGVDGLPGLPLAALLTSPVDAQASRASGKAIPPRFAAMAMVLTERDSRRP